MSGVLQISVPKSGTRRMAAFWRGLGVDTIPQEDTFCEAPPPRIEDRSVFVGHFQWQRDSAEQFKYWPKVLLVRDPRTWLIARYRQIMRGVGGMSLWRKNLLPLQYEERLLGILDGSIVGGLSALDHYTSCFMRWLEEEPFTIVLRYEDLEENAEALLSKALKLIGWGDLICRCAEGLAEFRRPQATYDPFDDALPDGVREQVECRLGGVMRMGGYL